MELSIPDIKTVSVIGKINDECAAEVLFSFYGLMARIYVIIFNETETTKVKDVKEITFFD